MALHWDPARRRLPEDWVECHPRQLSHLVVSLAGGGPALKLQSPSLQHLQFHPPCLTGNYWHTQVRVWKHLFSRQFANITLLASDWLGSRHILLVYIMLMLSLSCNECCSAAGMSDIADVSWQSARDAVTLSRCHAMCLFYRHISINNISSIISISRYRSSPPTVCTWL